MWQFSVFVVLWYIWLEGNSRVFNDSFSTIDFLWDRITYLVSLWSLAHGLFNVVLVANIQRDWHPLSHGLSLQILAFFFFLGIYVRISYPLLYILFSSNKISFSTCKKEDMIYITCSCTFGHAWTFKIWDRFSPLPLA